MSRSSAGCAEPSAAKAGPEVVSGVVDVLAARLLRARWPSALVDVGPEQVLGADEGTRRVLEDQELEGRRSVLEAGRSGKRRQADAGRRAQHECRIESRLDAAPA